MQYSLYYTHLKKCLCNTNRYVQSIYCTYSDTYTLYTSLITLIFFLYVVYFYFFIFLHPSSACYLCDVFCCCNIANFPIGGLIKDFLSYLILKIDDHPPLWNLIPWAQHVLWHTLTVHKTSVAQALTWNGNRYSMVFAINNIFYFIHHCLSIYYILTLWTTWWFPYKLSDDRTQRN